MVKSLPSNEGDAGDVGSVPGLGRSPGEGKGYPLQYSGLENSMDCVVYGVEKSWTRLSDFHLHFSDGHLQIPRLSASPETVRGLPSGGATY